MDLELRDNGLIMSINDNHVLFGLASKDITRINPLQPRAYV